MEAVVLVLFTVQPMTPQFMLWPVEVAGPPGALEHLRLLAATVVVQQVPPVLTTAVVVEVAAVRNQQVAPLGWDLEEMVLLDLLEMVAVLPVIIL
jgi:hypothetical protein